MLGLKLPTDPRWAELVDQDLGAILSDHAWCEQKAASNAISMIVRYPENIGLVQELTRIAQEELYRGVMDTDAAGGRCVVLDPATGEVLAMIDIIRTIPDAMEYPFVLIGNRPSPGSPEYVPERRYRVIKEDKGRAIHPALGHNRCVDFFCELTVRLVNGIRHLLTSLVSPCCVEVNFCFRVYSSNFFSPFCSVAKK